MSDDSDGWGVKASSPIAQSDSWSSAAKKQKTEFVARMAVARAVKQNADDDDEHGANAGADTDLDVDADVGVDAGVGVGVGAGAGAGAAKPAVLDGADEHATAFCF